MSGRRPSLAEGTQFNEMKTTSEKDYLKGERRLSVTSLRLRSEIEMWMIEEIPKLFGASDASGLDKSLQEDAQGEFLNAILFSTETLSGDDVGKKIDDTFTKAASTEKYADFKQELAKRIMNAREAFTQAKKESKEVPRNSIPCANTVEEKK